MSSTDRDGIPPVPAGYGTVTPWIISPDTARLIDFTRAAFGAEELARVPGPDGGIGHAEVRIGDSVTAVTALFFGDRVGRVRDPLGNIWWIQAHVEDVDPAELARRPQDAAAAEALRYVETSLDAAMRDRG